MVLSLSQCPSIGNQDPKFELPEYNLVSSVCRLISKLNSSMQLCLQPQSGIIIDFIIVLQLVIADFVKYVEIKPPKTWL